MTTPAITANIFKVMANCLLPLTKHNRHLADIPAENKHIGGQDCFDHCFANTYCFHIKL